MQYDRRTVLGLLGAAGLSGASVITGDTNTQDCTTAPAEPVDREPIARDQLPKEVYEAVAGSEEYMREDLEDINEWLQYDQDLSKPVVNKDSGVVNVYNDPSAENRYIAAAIVETNPDGKYADLQRYLDSDDTAPIEDQLSWAYSGLLEQPGWRFGELRSEAREANAPTITRVDGVIEGADGGVLVARFDEDALDDLYRAATRNSKEARRHELHDVAVDHLALENSTTQAAYDV